MTSVLLLLLHIQSEIDFRTIFLRFAQVCCLSRKQNNKNNRMNWQKQNKTKRKSLLFVSRRK